MRNLTAAALTRFSWQVLRVCSVSRRPFCSKEIAPGVSADLFLLICTSTHTHQYQSPLLKCNDVE